MAEDGIKIEVASILSHRTKKGLIEFVMGDQRVQLEVSKAREVISMLQGALEAAISDEAIYTFLVRKVGLSEDREIRQGTRETVFPN
jgi:hypothetical protein